MLLAATKTFAHAMLSMHCQEAFIPAAYVQRSPHSDSSHRGAPLCRIGRLAGPLIAQNLFGYSLAVIAAGFVGHLDSAVLLSSAVLANSFYNVTGLSLMVGLSAGMETLCGQASGTRGFSCYKRKMKAGLLAPVVLQPCQ